jgi:hypothetical protein
MAVSTKSLQSVYNVIAAQGIPDPRAQAGGYGDDLALDLAGRVMADLITERFNWKFNRATAAPIYTNSWQQDYPQPAQAGGPIAWGQDCDIVQINSTALPKPLNWDGAVLWVRELTRTSIARWRPTKICWMYNSQLSWGTWPGAIAILYPLVGVNAPAGSNPILNFIDSHGNYLILTTFGTTGTTAPAAAANAPEGTTVTDGSCVWTVVSATSQGFRLDSLPNAVGPTFQLAPSYQLDAPNFANFQQLLTPIPDSFSRHFQTGLEWACKMACPNPAIKEDGIKGYPLWLKSMETMIKQGDKEPNVYRIVPETSVVESRWGWKGPFTADQPV